MADRKVKLVVWVSQLIDLLSQVLRLQALDQLTPEYLEKVGEVMIKDGQRYRALAREWKESHGTKVENPNGEVSNASSSSKE